MCADISAKYIEQVSVTEPDYIAVNLEDAVNYVMNLAR